MSRGVARSVVEVHAPHGTLSVHVCVAWAQCACGKHLARVGDESDGAVAGLAEAEYEAGWQGDVCAACAARSSRG